MHGSTFLEEELRAIKRSLPLALHACLQASPFAAFAAEPLPDSGDRNGNIKAVHPGDAAKFGRKGSQVNLAHAWDRS